MASAVALVLFPLSALASITYSRSPIGAGNAEAPVTITWSFDNIQSDFGMSGSVDRYYITLDDDYNPIFPPTCADAVTEKSGTWIVNEPDISLPDPVKGVLIVGFSGACEVGDEPYYFEGTGASTIFTIIEAVAGWTVSNATFASSTLLALSVGGNLIFYFFAILVVTVGIAVGILFLYWAIRQGKFSVTVRKLSHEERHRRAVKSGKLLAVVKRYRKKTKDRKRFPEEFRILRTDLD